MFRLISVHQDLILKDVFIFQETFKGREGEIAPPQRHLVARNSGYLFPVIQQIFTKFWTQILGAVGRRFGSGERSELLSFTTGKNLASSLGGWVLIVPLGYSRL